VRRPLIAPLPHGQIAKPIANGFGRRMRGHGRNSR
jgi:hypothetical protein